MRREGPLKAIVWIILFISQLAFAEEWICKEASSVRNGQTILSCGVATSNILENARSDALKNAKHEFHQVCSSSADCRTKDFVSTGKRTDCQKTDNVYTCYRAVEFQILDREKADITVDIDEVESQIEDKQNELRKLKQRLGQQKQVNALNEEIEATKIKLETDIENLNDKIDPISIQSREYDYKGLNKPWSLGFHTFYSSYPNFGDANSALGLGLRVEKRFLKRYGLQVDVSYGSDLYSKEPDDTGNPSTSKTFRGMMTSTELVVGIPIYFVYQYYIKPIAGTVSFNRTDKQVDYSGLGTKSNSSDIKHSRSDAFYGLGLGYVTKPVDAAGSKYYFELSGRCITDCSNIHLNALVGIQLSF